MISAGLVSAFAILILILFVLPIMGAPSIFSFNPARMAQQILRTSDFGIVIQGFLVGFLIPSVVLGIISVIFRQKSSSLGLASATVLVVTIIGFTLSVIITSPAAGEPYLDIRIVETDRGDLSDDLILPTGFVAKAYLPIGIKRITSIAMGENDRLFIGSYDGVIITVDDVDNDGLGESIRTFGSKDGALLGLAVSQNGQTVYASGNGDVIKFQDNDLDGKADHREKIIRDLPSFVYGNHSNNGLVIGPDKRIYMTVGGTSGTGPENYELGGTILTSNIDGTDLQVYARGLRNSYDLAFTSSGMLVATDNGPEMVPNDFDEINVIVAGGHYGYPDFFGVPPTSSGTIAPVYLLTPHVVPTGIMEYPSGQFPTRYHGSLFLTLFMTNDPTFMTPFDNSKVVEIMLDGSTPDVNVTVEDFASGFINAIDVTVDSQGRLYIADFTGGQIYQISYTGEIN